MSTGQADLGTTRVGLLRIDHGDCVDVRVDVIKEAAIALVYNGTSHAVMMATPTDLEDFAFGFSLGEGIVGAADELQVVEVLERGDGIVLEMTIPQARSDALQTRHRRTLGVSGCGLCGTESLEAALRPLPLLVSGPPIAVAQIIDGLQRLESMQSMNRASGGAHAAAWCDANGLLVREDVGRHCAFDKLVGALSRTGRNTRDGFALVSSRASYELVHKAATADIGMLVAISAPTTAAIDLAERCGLCLIAFARGAQMNVYTHTDRVQK